MKKVLLSLVFLTASLSAFEIKAKEVGSINAGFLETKTIHEACVNGVMYYFISEGYKSAFAPKIIPDPERPGRTIAVLCK